jgi:crotonobetainyl-CoA:carnitine CoA-transferase CaiB-like acyl-CoA transferase
MSIWSTAAGTRASGTLAGGPLAGIRVLELGANLAGPYAAEILSHLGADVVKVERPEGDDARRWGAPVDAAGSAGSSFHAVNMNKRSVVVDLADAGARAALERLVAEADVLVQNMRPGVLEQFGLDAAAVRARHPRLVYCAVGAFGTQGPLRNNPGYEPMVQAFAGLMMLQGTADGGPMRIGTQVLDHGTGMWAAMGCLAALFQRDRTGLGCTVDTSLFETALGWLTIPGAQYQCFGSLPERHATGSGRLIPFQAFETKNGPVVIAAGNDRLFAKVAHALGRPEWASDPRYMKNADRVRHRDGLLADIQAILLTRTKGEWIDIFSAADVPCGPINDVAQALAHPQTAATGMLQAVPGLGKSLVGLPISFDGERPAVRGSAPTLGAHTDELLR